MLSKHRSISRTLEAFCYDKSGRLLSHAENSYCKTHPIQAHFAKLVGLDAKQYLHAEIHAMLKAKDKKVHSVHVFRRNKAGRLLMAKPCPICFAAMKAYGVEKVFYSNNVGEIVQMNID